MLPVLFSTPVFTLYTYGIFLGLSLFWSLYFIWKYVRMTSHKEEDVFDVYLLSLLIGGFVGRIAYVAFHFASFAQKGIGAMLAIHLYPGVHLISALATLVGVSLLLFHRKKLPSMELVAHMSVGVTVGLAVISLGGLFAGTELGTITQFPLRIKYVGFDGLRHMVGLYQAFFYLMGAFLLDRAISYVRHHKHAYGMVVGLLLWVVGFGQIGFLPFKEVAIVYKDAVLMRYYEYGVISLILLTGLYGLVYHLRSYIFKSKRK